MVEKLKSQSGLFWLKDQMELLGFNTLEEVAQELGISPENLHRYFALETTPGMAMLPVLCKVLRASPETILKALEITQKHN